MEGKYQMGNPRTIAFIFLLCCALKLNNAVPIPAEATAQALPQETETYTETYTEVLIDTVLSSDTEGARQESQERPLTEPDDANDAHGGNADTQPVSDTNVMSDETLLTSSKEDSEGDTINDGGNDTHGLPHTGINSTAVSTKSTPHILSAILYDTSSILVSTSSTPGNSSATPQGSVSQAVVTSHHDSRQDEVSSTPGGHHSTPSLAGILHRTYSPAPHHLTSIASGILHHKTDSSQGSTGRVRVTPQRHHNANSNDVSSTPDGLTQPAPTRHHSPSSQTAILHPRTDPRPRTDHDESVNNNSTPSLEPYVTEIYTEIMERTELVMSDTDSRSDERDENDYTPHDPAKSTLSDSTPSTARHHLTPKHSGPSAVIHYSTQSTAGTLHHTPSSALQHSTPSTSRILHRITDSGPRTPYVESVNNEITPSLVPFVTEIYTEIVERTELVMSDTDSKSEEIISVQDEKDLEHKISEAGDESHDPDSSTPTVVIAISQNTDSTPHSTSSAPSHSSPKPLEFADRMVMTPYDTGPSLTNSAIVDTSFTPEYSDITLTPIHSSLPDPDVTPNEGMILSSVSAPSNIRHTSTSSTDNSGKNIIQSHEPLDTEIYTEIIEITELVMSDTDDDSTPEEAPSAQVKENSEQESLVSNARSYTEKTPLRSTSSPADRNKSTHSVVRSSPQNTDAFRDSTSSTPVTTPQDTTVLPVTSYTTDPNSQKVTDALADANSTPDGLDVTPELSDPSSTVGNLTPTQSQILHPTNITTPNTELHSTITPKDNDTPQDTELGDDTVPSQEPVVTEIYTEMIEVTKLPVADTEARSDDSALAPDNGDAVQRDINSNEGNDGDDAPEGSPSPHKTRSLSTPNVISSTLPTPASGQVSTRESLNTSSIGPHSTTLKSTSNATKSSTAETSPSPADANSTPDSSDASAKDNITPSSATAESSLNEPSNAPSASSTAKDTPVRDNITPSREPFETEIYTDIVEITELFMSDEEH